MSVAIASPVISPSPSSVFIPILIDYNLTQITPYVYVTAEHTARQTEQIFSNGIGCVINVAQELPQLVFPWNTGIESLKYPIEDNPTFPAAHYFDLVADRVAANTALNRRTLLYCSHGRSRSITFVLAYLIKHHRIPLPQAFALVKQRRQLALPNTGFWSQLRTYELHQTQRLHKLIYPIAHKSDYNKDLLGKISQGMQQILVRDPMINMFTNNIMPRYPKYRIYSRPIIFYPRRFVHMNSFVIRTPLGLAYRRYF